MKERTIMEIEQAMLSSLNNAQMKQLHEVLTHTLWGKEIINTDIATAVAPQASNTELLQVFLSAK
ncbi:MAG: integrase, partial [Oscillospiraceae bacterium]